MYSHFLHSFQVSVLRSAHVERCLFFYRGDHEKNTPCAHHTTPAPPRRPPTTTHQGRLSAPPADPLTGPTEAPRTPPRPDQGVHMAPLGTPEDTPASVPAPEAPRGPPTQHPTPPVPHFYTHFQKLVKIGGPLWTGCFEQNTRDKAEVTHPSLLPCLMKI